MSEEEEPNEGRESSDLFSVTAYRTGTSIPVLDEIPETREAIRARRVRRAAVATAAACAIAGAGWLGFHLKHRSEVAQAVEAAGDDGRVATARAALALLADDDDNLSTALSLRLRSALVLAGHEGSSGEAEALAQALAALPADDPAVARERGVAETYLALARGDLADAMQRASGVAATGGDFKAEALRARAVAAWAVGNVEIAMQAAHDAAAERPAAPRHAALEALLMARAGDAEAGLGRLDELPETAQNAATLVARARILDRSGADLERVVEQAQAVLDDAEATDHERAWARLLLARAAAAAGDRARARAQLGRASEVAPPGDELFTLTLTEAALRMNANYFASEQARRLPAPLSTNAGRRAQLSAELALARHDLPAAVSALEGAPASARTTLARARLADLQGRVEQAGPLYRDAATDPAQRVPATVWLASMQLANGHADRAVATVAPLLELHPNHPDLVPVAAEAQLGRGRAGEAARLVAPALELHPEDVRLLAAHAHVQAALGRWQDALSTLDRALAIEDDDADLHADRGAAAAHLGRSEVARAAYDDALALEHAHPVALVGRLELDVEQLSPGPAREILSRVDAAALRSLAIERLRARLLTIEIAGQGGTRAVRRALVRHPRDPELVWQLGWLYMQAEEYAHAVRRFSQLLEGPDDPVRAILAKALAQARMRAANPARAALDRILEDVELDALEATVRAQLHALSARLAWADHGRSVARREARAALALDPHSTEAHLVLAEMAQDRDEDSTASYQASLVGVHPSARALALLSIREETVTDVTCEYARRYRRAAPNGQYARGVWRVQRDCRHRTDSSDASDPEPLQEE